MIKTAAAHEDAGPPQKLIGKLIRSSRYRRKAGKTVIDGLHLLQEYRGEIGIPETVGISRSAVENHGIQRALAGIPADRVFEIQDSVFRALSPVKSPSGILAIISIPKIIAPEQWQSCVILEDIQDPGNLGTILRSAAAAGLQVACLSQKSADPWSPKALRAGMGAQFYLEIREADDLEKTASRFPGKVLAAEPAAPHSVFEEDLRGRVAFLIGNEGAGLSVSLRKTATAVAAIKMPGRGESLNAAAAASILFFEKVRQEGQGRFSLETDHREGSLGE